MKPMKLMVLAAYVGLLSAGAVLAADQMRAATSAPEAGSTVPTIQSTHTRAEVKSDLAMAIKTKARPVSAESEDVPMASAKSTRTRSEVKSELSAANKAGKHPQIGD
jgi:predicted secreted protein